MISRYILLTSLLIPSLSFGQDHTTIDSLKSEIDRIQWSLDRQRENNRRLEYRLASKEMAIRSIEMKDSIYQVLLAVQAYKFCVTRCGNITDIDVYKALYAALKRYKDPLVETLPNKIDQKDKTLPDALKEIANRLCSKIARNMTVGQWNKYASQLPYEATCPVSK